MVVSFSTMDLEEDTVTMVYKHAYAGQITMTLPVYRVALSEEGTYYNLATDVQVTGAGVEKVSTIGFAVSECTSEVEMFEVREGAMTVSVSAENLDYHLCVMYENVPAFYFVTSVTFKVGGGEDAEHPAVDRDAAAADDDPQGRGGGADAVGSGPVRGGQGGAGRRARARRAWS